MFKRLSWSARTLGVQARVGEIETNASHGQRKISVNKQCGSVSSVATDENMATFLCMPPLTGRYVTLQTIAPSQMNIGEIKIFTVGKDFCSNFSISAIGNVNVDKN